MEDRELTAAFILVCTAGPDVLLQFKPGSFHVAFDKGALDALMGEDTQAASTAGGKLLSEVQRILDSAEGHYLCVTLGQPHVLGTPCMTPMT